MHLFKNKTFLCVCGMAAGALVSRADPIPYPNVGTQNPVTYTFTAAATGQIDAYFAGSGAGYTEEVEMLVNGTATGVFGLNNQTSHAGEEFDLGSVVAGDSIVFVDYIQTTGAYVYSNPADNTGGYAGQNHIYSTAATAGQAYAGSPAGTYVAFEDLPGNSADWNYHDDTFVFTNVNLQPSNAASAPDGGATITMFGIALLGLCAMRRGRFARA